MSEAFGLAHPWALALLLLLPAWWVHRRRQRRHALVELAPLQVAPRRGRGALLRPLATLLEVALLALLVLGASGPYREIRLELVDDPGIDVALVLDVSLSMLAEDLEPNRLEALRRIARDFVARSGGNRVGIVVFAGDAYVQTPLTTDHASLLALLDDVTVYTLDQGKSGGTALGDALLVAGERMLASRVAGRDQSLVLITDGASTQGVDPELAARWLAGQGLRIHAVGVGGTEPVRVVVEGRVLGGDSPYLAVLDDTLLRAVAESAGGRFYRATDTGALEAVFAELARLESAPLSPRSVAERRSLAGLAAALALVLAIVHLALEGVVLRRPWR